MKRLRFRLEAVLRIYEIQKERSEYELQMGLGELRRIEDEIARQHEELASLGDVLRARRDPWTTDGWLACHRRAEQISTRLAAEEGRRREQAQAVEKLRELRNRWAVAVETLVALRSRIRDFNDAEAARALQVQLDELASRPGFHADPSRAGLS